MSAQTKSEILRANCPTILLVDDHEILTTGMSAFLRSEGFSVEAVNPRTPNDVLEHPVVEAGGLVVTDLQMPQIPDVLALISALGAKRVKVVALTGSTDPFVVGRALRAGASAVVEKTEGLGSLISLIEDVLIGKTVRSDQREDRLSQLRVLEQEGRETLRAFDQLTIRERQILFELMAGRSATAIAAGGFVALATVRAQIRSILAKLDVSSQLEAVAMAHRAGFRLQESA